jgi:uracil-DNA glycosylase
MIFEKVFELLESKIFNISVNEDGLFNPYYDLVLKYDLPEANQIRRDNLRNYICSFTQNPTTLVVGEAPGWRGCRFSGVPFTSEYQLVSGILPFDGNQSSISEAPYKESTATMFWECMKRFHTRFFAWNCIPFHPFENENHLSNRTPTSEEILVYSELLSEIISAMNPLNIVAIGRSTEKSLENLGVCCSYVRHPSHGGANEFKDGMEKIFG